MIDGSFVLQGVDAVDGGDFQHVSLNLLQHL